jgi:hypothetical protein
MRKIVFYISIFLFSINTNSQINFPDINFKNKLLLSNSTNPIACIGTSSQTCVAGPIDSNNNGQIEVSEALMVARLDLLNSNINNLSGIEYFTNLDYLNCASNNLTTIDISQLILLKQLGCFNNQLTSLNINNQTQLIFLFANNNQITSIDFSNNIALQRAFLWNNQFTTLNFGNNPNFFDLECKNNPNLTTINIKNGATQLFPPNTFYNECWSNCPNLSYICADANEISSLQSFLSTCGNSASITVDSLCPLGNEEFSVNSLVFYPNPVADILHIDLTNETTKFEQVTIVDSVGKTIVTKKITPFTTNEIEVTSLQSGFYFVILNNNEVSKKMKLIKK